MARGKHPIEALRFTDAVTGLEPARWLACPCCGFHCNHIGEARRVSGHDGYDAWEGRGDLQVTEMEGECGSRWLLCLGFHKGSTCIFTRVTAPCQVRTPVS